MDYSEFRKIINGSKQFTFHGSVLELTGYYTGKRVRLDLGNIDEDMFEELVVEDDEEEY